MQSKIDLLNAYANKIALALSMRQHKLNKLFIQQTDHTMFSLDLLAYLPANPQEQQYTGFQEEENLCNHALELAKTCKLIDDLYRQRNQILVEEVLGCERTQIALSNIEQKASLFNHLLQSFKKLDLNIKESKQRLRRFILSYYRKFPCQVSKLVKALKIEFSEVKGWIQYNQKRERKLKLRDQLRNMSGSQKITIEILKKIARKIYKTRLFRATDNWCIKFTKRYGLRDIIEFPQQQE